MTLVWLGAIALATASIVWGAERFAAHLAAASVGIGVSTFALAILLAGAEPEELATAVTASARDTAGIAYGDVVGANVAICLIALGVGAVVAPLPFGRRVRPYAWFGVPIALIATGIAWDGAVERIEGGALVAMYVVYVSAIWLRERRPPALGETDELAEASAMPRRRRVGRDLGILLVGLAAMALGAVLLVEAVRQLTGAEETQTVLALTLVGFATAFELVVLAWSTARRGATEATIAGVVGSLTYNVTMTLGAAAIVRPLRLADPGTLRPALVMMLAVIALVSVLGSRGAQLDRREGLALIALYPVFVVATALS